jgi:hypothetical protein
MPQDPPAFRPYSPQDLSSTISGSPWSASPESGTNYDSIYVPDVDSGDDPAEYADTDQFFDSLPRLSSPGGTLPEPSASRSREQQSPPSNQQEQRHLYQLSDSPDPFADLIDLTPPRSPSRPTTQQSRNTTRESSVVDLTESSPTVNNTNDMPPSRKRKADTPGDERPNKSSRGGAASGNLGGSPTRQAKVETPDLVDLVDIDDDSKYEDFMLKRQAELVKKQQQEEATRPVRLAEFQCIICMDNPTDLTVTHCGMCTSPLLLFSYFD